MGDLTEYVVCIIDTKSSIKFTQTVLFQSFEDEFGFSGTKVMIPTETGSVLVRNEEEFLSEVDQTKYQSSVGNCCI